MRCDVVAVGTELLLGQIVDTNSSWIGEQLALTGIDSLRQTKVGDNLDRIVRELRDALEQADAVIVCGGLGPTQDDITRDAIAAVMGVSLVRDDELEDRIRSMFGSRGRFMPDNNLRQADVPEGASILDDMPGTAPGLRCPIDTPDGAKVIYAVPGVPWEMQQMMTGSILPDLQRRAGLESVIRSRVVRTWGQSESGIAEMLEAYHEELEQSGRCTLAFLASGIEGLKVRLTAKAGTVEEAEELLEREVHTVCEVLGDIVFSVHDESMEQVIVRLLAEQGLTMGTAESITGGLIAARITDVPGASAVFRGGIVSYASEVKFDLLGVPDGPVITEEAVTAMVEGACHALGCDVAVATTGVAGPDGAEGLPPGTVWLATSVDGSAGAVTVRLPGDRDRVRQFSVISVLNLLRQQLEQRAR